ncbi:MAG TPA: FAD-binding protein, partial [Candidatus Eisenbacteria bacterium]|nr:FAD-binding protein [Candidatus Eisenbacteria bacterium]
MNAGLDALDALDAALGVLGSRLGREVPLGPLCTYRVGGPAARFVEVVGDEELLAVARAVAGLGPAAPPVLVVGRGSNLLVGDAGFPGLVLQLGAYFESVERLDEPAPGGGALVRAGGAAALPVVARRTVAMGLTGFEWAVGVPGSIGGAVRMNAGGHGSDMAAALVRVRVVDLDRGHDVTVPATDLRLGYRTSAVAGTRVVVWADLALAEGDVARGEAELSDIVRWRRDHQPGGANAGSVFTNPEGDSAGRLVEAAGAKGLR